MVGAQGAPLTRNYLCATNHDALPATTQAGFGWNWVEPNEVTSDSGNVVDKQIIDTYIIGVDDKGRIKATLKSSVPVDNSQKPEANGF
jgi:hypothetical protein